MATAVARGGSPDDVFAATVAELHAVVGRRRDQSHALRSRRLRHASWRRSARSGSRSGRGSRSTGESVTARGAAHRPHRAHRRPRAGARSDSRAPARKRDSLGRRRADRRRRATVGRDDAAAGPAGRPRGMPRPRLSQFTDLVGTAIANAESRAELLASQIPDRHDRRPDAQTDRAGPPRRCAAAARHPDDEAARTGGGASATSPRRDVEEIAAGLDDVLDDLRETARGLHPVMLSRGGLGPALKALGRRSPVPVELDVRTQERLPEPVEVAAYYVVAEALTNAAKHAHASVVRVEAEVDRRRSARLGARRRRGRRRILPAGPASSDSPIASRLWAESSPCTALQAVGRRCASTCR